MSRREVELLRTFGSGRPVKVDRDANVLRGYVAAQLGPFKSDGRGEFDLPALEEIVRLGNASRQALKSRFGHETACDDGLGKFLGRPKDFVLGETKTASGEVVPAVRADLHFDKTAMEEPPGGGKPLGVYVMDLAESDAGALSSSLVLKAKKTYRRKADGTLETDADGEPLPPLWFPEKLMGSDIVDTGDAVDGLLSVADLPNEYLWQATEMLDGLFADKSRAEVAERLTGWLGRYLDQRFGPPPKPEGVPADLFLFRQRQREREAKCDGAISASVP